MIDPAGSALATKNERIAINQTSANSKSSSSVTANFDAFLQLLVTQLKHQDPLKPMDPTQTVTQLATFASVEQSVQTNARLAILTAQSELSQASDLVGRAVISADGSRSGIIQAVKTGPDGLAATLEDGNKIVLTSGVTIGHK